MQCLPCCLCTKHFGFTVIVSQWVREKGTDLIGSMFESQPKWYNFFPDAVFVFKKRKVTDYPREITFTNFASHLFYIPNFLKERTGFHCDSPAAFEP